MCDFTQKLPFNTLTAGRPPNWVIAVYYLLVAAAAASSHLKFVQGKKLHALRLIFCASAVFLIFRIRYIPPMAMYMLDVGQGDGLVIRTCDESGSSVILVDGGSSSRKGIGENVEIPFLKYHGISKVDYCVMTHDDLDHCSGLMELIEQADSPGGIRIGQLGMPSVAEERKGETYLRIEKTAKQKGIPVTYLHRGMSYSKGRLKLTCLHPAKDASYEDANEYSVVMLLIYDRFSSILTGDLEGQGEKDLLDHLGTNKISTDVIKIAHHGSKGGTTDMFLQKISSRVALISCGYGNRYGHPAPETISRIMNAGMDILDTRKDGQISVTTDGRGEYSVHTFY
jgi:competence protein ComEC